MLIPVYTQRSSRVSFCPICELYALPPRCGGVLHRNRYLYSACRSLTLLLRCAVARASLALRRGPVATPAGLAQGGGGLYVAARGRGLPCDSAALRGRRPCRAVCVPAAPAAPAVWWAGFARVRRPLFKLARKFKVL